MFKDLFGKANHMVNSLFAHWSKPARGKHLSTKEAAAFSVGGMGITGASVLQSYVTLTAGVYIAVALGITVRDIWIVGIINSIFTIIRSPLISMMVDNTNTKWGKFRPYLIFLPLPIMLSYIAIGNVPFLFADYSGKLISFTIIFVLLSTFTGVYNSAFNSLIQVITPDSNERNNLMSVGAFIYSLGPSISNLFFPIFAQILYGNSGVNDPGVYKIFLPIFASVFMLLGMWTAFGTKERLVVSKKYKAKVKFTDGIKKICKNKYFWVTNISGWLSLLAGLSISLNAWICLYILDSSMAIGLIATVIGFASVPGMLLAPILIRKFGKKNLVIASKILQIVLTIPLFFLLNQPIIMIAIVFIINLCLGVQVVTGPIVTADVYDYQQFKTGDRLEGFMMNMGSMISTAIGIGTSAVMPFIYQYLGFVQNSDVLYDSAVRNPIFRWTFIISIVSGVLGVIPYFFYDLTEKKHEKIMEELRIRAAKEDAEIAMEAAANPVEPLVD